MLSVFEKNPTEYKSTTQFHNSFTQHLKSGEQKEPPADRTRANKHHVLF